MTAKARLGDGSHMGVGATAAIIDIRYAQGCSSRDFEAIARSMKREADKNARIALFGTKYARPHDFYFFFVFSTFGPYFCKSYTPEYRLAHQT